MPVSQRISWFWVHIFHWSVQMFSLRAKKIWHRTSQNVRSRLWKNVCYLWFEVNFHFWWTATQVEFVCLRKAAATQPHLVCFLLYCKSAEANVGEKRVERQFNPRFGLAVAVGALADWYVRRAKNHSGYFYESPPWERRETLQRSVDACRMERRPQIGAKSLFSSDRTLRACIYLTTWRCVGDQAVPILLCVKMLLYFFFCATSLAGNMRSVRRRHFRGNGGDSFGTACVLRRSRTFWRKTDEVPTFRSKIAVGRFRRAIYMWT